MSMSGTNTLGASVSYATADGTATAGSDYVSASGTLTWAAGDTSSKTISVTVNGDTTVEPDETFYVNLSSPSNATISKSQGVGTIQNDDVQSLSTWQGAIGLYVQHHPSSCCGTRTTAAMPTPHLVMAWPGPAGFPLPATGMAWHGHHWPLRPGHVHVLLAEHELLKARPGYADVTFHLRCGRGRLDAHCRRLEWRRKGHHRPV